MEDTKRPPVTTATEALSEQGNSPKAATASQGNKSISIVANGNAKPVGKGKAAEMDNFTPHAFPHWNLNSQ